MGKIKLLRHGTACVYCFFKFDWHLIALFSDAHARGGSNSVSVIYKTGFGAKARWGLSGAFARAWSL